MTSQRTAALLAALLAATLICDTALARTSEPPTSAPEALQRMKDAPNHERPDARNALVASGQEAVPLLLGMGVDSLSMSAGSLLRVKSVVRNTSRARARQLLQAALRMEEAYQVKRFMGAALEDLGLGGLVRPGK